MQLEGPESQAVSPKTYRRLPFGLLLSLYIPQHLQLGDPSIDIADENTMFHEIVPLLVGFWDGHHAFVFVTLRQNPTFSPSDLIKRQDVVCN